MDYQFFESFTFSGGETKRSRSGGNFLLLMTATAAVTLKFVKQGSVVFTIDSAAEGQKVKAPNQPSPGRIGLDTGFDWVEITSATAQTVEIITNTGGWETDLTRVSGRVTATPPASGDDDSEITAAATPDTGTISAISSQKQIALQAPATNTGTVRIFTNTATKGIEMQPGDFRVFDLSGSLKWYIATTGDKLQYTRLA